MGVTMRNGWASTIEQLLHSPTLPMWVTLAAAAFFALILLLTLIRAEKTVANGALTVITLLAIGIAVAATVRRFDPLDGMEAAETRAMTPTAAAVPALSCLDGLAGEGVEAPCERSLFASADVAAAAVSYTAGQISRLVPLDQPGAQAPEQQSLRRTLEHDRYGLVAQVLTARDRCSETDCKLFALFSDPSRIKANIRDHLYDATIGRYALAWATGATSAASSPTAPGAAATVPATASVPTGRPNSIEFPNAGSIPPVSIMTTEPPAPAAAAAPSAPPKPSTNANAQAPAKPVPVKRPAPKPKPAASPTPIAPPSSDDN